MKGISIYSLLLSFLFCGSVWADSFAIKCQVEEVRSIYNQKSMVENLGRGLIRALGDHPRTDVVYSPSENQNVSRIRVLLFSEDPSYKQMLARVRLFTRYGRERIMSYNYDSAYSESEQFVSQLAQTIASGIVGQLVIEEGLEGGKALEVEPGLNVYDVDFVGANNGFVILPHREANMNDLRIEVLGLERDLASKNAVYKVPETLPVPEAFQPIQALETATVAEPETTDEGKKWSDRPLMSTLKKVFSRAKTEKSEAEPAQEKASEKVAPAVEAEPTPVAVVEAEPAPVAVVEAEPAPVAVVEAEPAPVAVAEPAKKESKTLAENLKGYFSGLRKAISPKEKPADKEALKVEVLEKTQSPTESLAENPVEEKKECTSYKKESATEEPSSKMDAVAQACQTKLDSWSKEAQDLVEYKTQGSKDYPTFARSRQGGLVALVHLPSLGLLRSRSMQGERDTRVELATSYAVEKSSSSIGTQQVSLDGGCARTELSMAYAPEKDFTLGFSVGTGFHDGDTHIPTTMTKMENYQTGLSDLDLFFAYSVKNDGVEYSPFVSVRLPIGSKANFLSSGEASLNAGVQAIGELEGFSISGQAAYVYAKDQQLLYAAPGAYYELKSGFAGSFGVGKVNPFEHFPLSWLSVSVNAAQNPWRDVFTAGDLNDAMIVDMGALAEICLYQNLQVKLEAGAGLSDAAPDFSFALGLGLQF